MRLLLIAGPDGSGKTTITTPAILEHFDIAPDRYINADDIARALAAVRPELNPTEREQLALRQARDQRQPYRELGQSYAFETVFSHPGTFLDIRRARDAGYEVVVLFVTTPNPEINVARVARRVQGGGHDVPVERIRSRYERTMRLLPRIVEQANQAYVFDNGGAAPQVYPFLPDGGLAADLPEYLRRRLAGPLMSRRSERAVLGGSPVSDEAAGVYAGPFAEFGAHYALQLVDGARVRHDRLLLTGTPVVGARATVRYADGVGSLSQD